MTQIYSKTAKMHMQQQFKFTLLLPLLFLANVSFFTDVKAANIVFFSPTGSYSHRVSVWPLVRKLVENGHHITFISAYPPKDPLPNVTELVPEAMAKSANDFMQGGELDVTHRISGSMEACYDHVPQLGIDTCKMFLDDPEVQVWLKTDPKIDLFVVDWFVSDCILGLAYKMDAPFIFYSPTVMVGYLYETFGFIPDTAGVPDFERHFTPPLTFLERMNNELQPLIWKYKMAPYFDELSKLVREKLDIPNMPPLEDIVRNASLLLWSESVIEGYPHTLPPNWITVGGMHCKENPEPLPNDLEKIVQKGKDGFIYISFGSAVVPGNLPERYIDAFFNAVKELPQIQFLWKWTGAMPKQKVPDNLYIGKWFPQQDLLGFAHENENLISNLHTKR